MSVTGLGPVYLMIVTSPSTSLLLSKPVTVPFETQMAWFLELSKTLEAMF